MALKWTPITPKINPNSSNSSILIGQPGGGIAYSIGIVNIFGVDYVVRKNHDDSLPIVLCRYDEREKIK